MDRRDFFKKSMGAAAALGAGGLLGCGRANPRAEVPVETINEAIATSQTASAQAATATRVGSSRFLDAAPGDAHIAVASKQAPADLVTAAIDAFGEREAIFKQGDKVVIKPNLAWAREPSVGANTHPEVLKAVIQLAKDAGAGEVVVAEHSCVKSMISFEMSGAKEVCEALGVRLVGLDSEAMYEEQTVGGVNIDKDLLAREILESDVYINLPCLKHHGGSTVTISMKNQMGTNWDRQRYHSSGSAGDASLNLHQNIADLAKVLRPTLVIVDATRALKTSGPQGPGELDQTETIIVSHDMVAADAVGAQMLGHAPDKIPHIRLAAEKGVGRMDLETLDIARV